MSHWPRFPCIYEIGTWVWLSDLTRKYGSPVDLKSVPAGEWDAIAALGFDAVWLMGVWERSPAGMAIANCNPGLLESFRRVLPDFQPADNVGSPYCIRRYTVDERLGGADGLAVARGELARRGLRLLLDFVPNHVAPDHPWVVEHPEYFIHATANEAAGDPASYLQSGGRCFACGRDPYFPAWADVLQLNAFDPGLRRAALETLFDIAGQCDGVRCDMAMLMMNDVFQRTWGQRAGEPPPGEYWTDNIAAVKRAHPDFVFVAEAYWDLEWQLQQQGFDFCYDKTLYDRLEHGGAESIRLHLCADDTYQDKLVRFIENHDEPRAAATFTRERQRAAAVVMATIPGARLFHEGQLEGRKVRAPVFLGRRPDEPVDTEMAAFYRKLLRLAAHPTLHQGQWSLCERIGWPDNPSFLNLLAWNWTDEDRRVLVAVNWSGRRAQGRVRAPWPDVRGRRLQMVDVLAGVTYERDGSELQGDGLYVDLGPWEYHVLECVCEERHPIAAAA